MHVCACLCVCLLRSQPMFICPFFWPVVGRFTVVVAMGIFLTSALVWHRKWRRRNRKSFKPSLKQDRPKVKTVAGHVFCCSLSFSPHISASLSLACKTTRSNMYLWPISPGWPSVWSFKTGRQKHRPYLHLYELPLRFYWDTVRIIMLTEIGRASCRERV